MALHSYIVAADFHTRPEAIEAINTSSQRSQRQVSKKKGARSTTGPKARMIPRLFLLYMEWRDKACFEAHIATPNVKHAEDRLKCEKMLVEPAREWHS
jgi:quinol monooxygenase YgiN